MDNTCDFKADHNNHAAKSLKILSKKFAQSKTFAEHCNRNRENPEFI